MDSGMGKKRIVFEQNKYEYPLDATRQHRGNPYGKQKSGWIHKVMFWSVLFSMILLCACGKKEQETGKIYHIYSLNNEETAIMSHDYRTETTDQKILLQELLGELPLDEGRVITEVALYADRINITEEVVRLRSHLEELEKLLRSSTPSGRKMDFLLQEMNREINTIGSKSQIKDISMLVVENKAELEKIREQVQNLE